MNNQNTPVSEAKNSITTASFKYSDQITTISLTLVALADTYKRLRQNHFQFEQTTRLMTPESWTRTSFFSYLLSCKYLDPSNKDQNWCIQQPNGSW